MLILVSVVVANGLVLRVSIVKFVLIRLAVVLIQLVLDGPLGPTWVVILG